MKLLLAVAAAFNLLSAAGYALTAARIHQRAYLQGRKDEENWWIAIEGAVEQEHREMFPLDCNGRLRPKLPRRNEE